MPILRLAPVGVVHPDLPSSGLDEDDWIAVNARSVRRPIPNKAVITRRRSRRPPRGEPGSTRQGFFVANNYAARPNCSISLDQAAPRSIGRGLCAGSRPAAGQGLGKALLAAGLEHLKQAGKQPRPALCRGGPRRRIALYVRLLRGQP